MSLWQRTRPLRDFAVGVLLVGLVAWPWLSDRHRHYDADPAQWFEYAGTVVFVVAWGGASGLYSFLVQRLRDSSRLHIPFMISMAVGIFIGMPNMIFGGSIYHHGRLALQRSAMERVVEGGADCPALRCIRDESGVTAFVWGENPDVWTGACHDPRDVMAAALHAATEDREAGGAPQARVFGGVSRRAKPISGDWIRCAVRSVETAPR